ncbi:MAG: hypothetical protein V2G42_09260, partial [bacterium JZ-2024 1]
LLERSGGFVVIESNQPGFVREYANNPFRLVFENGKLFPAIGIGDCILDIDHSGSPLDNWGLDGGFRSGEHSAGRTVDIDTYLSAYSSAGFNLFRWSVDNCSFKLWETISPQGNRYLEQEGRWGDELVQKLRQYGFRVYMVIFGFEPPFAQEAKDAAKMDAVKRYTKYIVDRYGAYVDFWELMNEATAEDAWYTIVADHIRSVDPYGHLISTSWQKPEHPAIEITSPHWYQKESEFESDTVTGHQIERWKPFGKPIIFGEQGNTEQNWDEHSALRMRLRSWSAFFNEGVLIFWNTSGFKDYRNESAANLYIGPEERSYVRALQEFVRELEPDVQRVTVTVSDPSRVRAYGLRSAKSFAAYLHNFADHEGSTIGLSLTLDSPISGIGTWYSPATGQVIQQTAVAAGMQTLSVPPFVVDIALKIQVPQRSGAQGLSAQQITTVRYVPGVPAGGFSTNGKISAVQSVPIELLWLLLSAPLTEQTRDIYSRVATDDSFAKFDAFAVLTDPPTFETYNEAFRQGVEDLSAQARRPMIYASFTVGTEGWETSNNSQFAQARGIAFHAERNMPRERWFEELTLAQMGLWGMTIEALARVPTATELRDYLIAFGEAAKAHSQKAIVWYTANWERFRPAGGIVRPVFQESLDHLDYVVWMDTRSLLDDQGETGARHRIAEIKALTGEKTVLQIGFFGPDAFDKAKEFMRLAQESGVHRFALYLHPQLLSSPEWAEFYQGLRK